MHVQVWYAVRSDDRLERVTPAYIEFARKQRTLGSRYTKTPARSGFPVSASGRVPGSVSTWCGQRACQEPWTDHGHPLLSQALDEIGGHDTCCGDAGLAIRDKDERRYLA